MTASSTHGRPSKVLGRLGVGFLCPPSPPSSSMSVSAGKLVRPPFPSVGPLPLDSPQLDTHFITTLAHLDIPHLTLGADHSNRPTLAFLFNSLSGLSELLRLVNCPQPTAKSLRRAGCHQAYHCNSPLTLLSHSGFILLSRVFSCILGSIQVEGVSSHLRPPPESP
ncbi:hypothetical protein CRG98_032179 [Punica granatum]|uniref:Uncharacterized protein n=1 Tax=Punica granatum TaxID=22663 RepID=A0A2I0ITV3_PUNGR|nr:hypothetical protein CRG98_032179 [Punica granatum]